MSEATVVVTGNRGYLGSAVSTRLRGEGYTVIGYDNGRGARVTDINGVASWQYDLRQFETLMTFLELMQPDVVVHLAALPGVEKCREVPEESVPINVTGTANLLGSCRALEIPVVFASTVAVYGDGVEMPITPDQPRLADTVYGRQKVAGEDMVRALARDAFPAMILQMTNLYGRHDVDGQPVQKPTVLNYFVDNAMQGGPIEVHAPGTQTRDFLHVLDAAMAFTLAVFEVTNREPGEVHTLPIAGHEELTIKELADAVALQVFNDTRRVEIVDNPRGDDRFFESFAVDPDPAMDVLSYEPLRSVDDTILEMVSE